MNRVEKIQKMLEESPSDAFLKHALALEYIKAGDDGEAEDLFREILEADPDYVGSYYHLGKLLERKEEIQNAVEIYKRGVDAALRKNDRHAANELRAAMEDLEE